MEAVTPQGNVDNIWSLAAIVGETNWGMVWNSWFVAGAIALEGVPR